jgi:ABC-2 type transport system permease protein
MLSLPRLSILRAFLVRDARRELSYPANLLLTFFSGVFTVVIWFFTVRFAGASIPREKIVGGDWFSFVLFGWAFLQYLQVSLFTFASNLREEQVAGTLEMLLATPEREETIVLSLAAWDYLWQTFQIAVLLSIATMFGLHWSFVPAGLLPAALLVLLTLAVYVGIGLVAAAWTIHFKKGAAVSVVASAAATIFGGVVFPPETLGPRLSMVSKLVPATWVNHGLRTTLLAGGSWREVGGDFAALTIFAILSLPAGLILFRFALEGARKRGDLASY